MDRPGFPDRPDRSDRPPRPLRSSRRRFAATSIAGLVTAGFSIGSAPGVAFAGQDAAQAPDAPEISTETIFDLSSLDGFLAGVAREFYLSASGLGDLVGLEAIAVLAAGIRFRDEEIASSALTEIRSVVPEVLERVIGSPNSGTKRSVAGDLGDENLGLVLTFPFPPGRKANEVDAGVTIVRKGADVQIIVGVAYDDALEGAIALAELIDGQWPSDDLFDLLPTAEDVPAPLALRVEAEFQSATRHVIPRGS